MTRKGTPLSKIALPTEQRMYTKTPALSPSTTSTRLVAVVSLPHNIINLYRNSCRVSLAAEFFVVVFGGGVGRGEERRGGVEPGRSL